MVRRWLDWLQGGRKGPIYRASERKLRLFNAACARRMWASLDSKHRSAVEAIERCADGDEGRDAELAAILSAWRSSIIVSTGASLSERMAAYNSRAQYALCLYRLGDDLSRHAAILHDLVGNPFRPALADCAWLAWNDGTVLKLARLIYDERAFDRLPLLADALEDAGCTDEAILRHCRELGEHVRGCWAVDLLLGKS